nr:rRNA methyltransferase [Anaerolineae bacterium]
MTGQWPTPQMAAAWGAGPWAAGAPAAGTMSYGTPLPGTMAPEQELAMLRSQAEALKGQLDQIAKRIEELEKK